MMRLLKHTLFTMTAVLLILCGSGCGESTNGISYEVKNDHAVVTGSNKGMTSVTLLSEYRGVPVTEIGPNAFKQSAIMEIVIPDSVRLISYSAFYNCSSLVDVTFPQNLEKIDSSAFSGCACLKSVHIPEGTEYIESEAFKDCFSLQDVILPSSLKRIDRKAFEHCTKLEEIRISGNIESLGDSIFKDCHALKKVYIGEGITGLDKCMLDLSGLEDHLEEVHYPKSYVPDLVKRNTSKNFYGKTVYVSNILSVRYAEEEGLNYRFEEGYSPLVCTLDEAVSKGFVSWNDNGIHVFGSTEGSGTLTNLTGKDMVIEVKPETVVSVEGGEDFTVSGSQKIFLSAEIYTEDLIVEYLKPFYYESEYSEEKSYLLLKGDDTYYRLIRTDGIVEIAIRVTESQKVSFPAGSYELKIAEGETWLGEERMYGENGKYTTTGLFRFEAGNTYSIMASQFGNIHTDTNPWGN